MGVAVPGVINTTGGVGLTLGVAVSSGVGVGDFIPTRVGVKVNVRVGVIGVAVGTGVNVFVDVGFGVDVLAGANEKLPTEQANERKAHSKIINIFFMGLFPA